MTASSASETAKGAARTAVQTAQGTLNTLTGGLSKLVSLNSVLLEAYGEASRAYLQQLTSLNEELAKFTSRRMKEQSDARQSLANCKDWSDALHAQQDFIQDSSKEYLDEAARLFKMMSQATLAGIGPFMERMESLPRELSASKGTLTPVSPATPPGSTSKAA